MEETVVIDQMQPKRTKDLIKIKVLGIGGGGNNAVNQMIKTDVDGAEYILINTEKGIHVSYFPPHHRIPRGNGARLRWHAGQG